MRDARKAPEAVEALAPQAFAPIDTREFEAFLFHEARLLDARRFDEWLGLFSATATYWVPSQPGQDNPHDTVSLIYDDRRMLETRVRQLGHPSAHAQNPPSRTSHLIGNVTVEEGDPRSGTYLIGSNFHMLEYRRDAQRLFGGSCRHRLRRAGASFEIEWKRVDLTNCDSVLEGISVLF